MNQDKKKARPSVAAPRQAEAGSILQDGNSHPNHTTPIPQAQAKISALLLPGRENAISRRDLEAMTGLDGRTIRLMIERERRRGTLILSDNRHGYFLSDDPVEAQRFVRSMRHRAGEILRTAEAVEGAAGRD